MTRRCAYVTVLLLTLAGCEALDPFPLVSHTNSRARIAPVVTASASPSWITELRTDHSRVAPPARRSDSAYPRVLVIGYPAAGTTIKMPILDVDASGKPILPAGRAAPVIDISDVRFALRGGFDL